MVADVENSVRGHNWFVVRNAIAQPPNILQAPVDEGPRQPNMREGCAEAWLPQAPVVPLRREICPEAEHQLRDDLAWRSSWSSGIMDRRIDFVLRISGKGSHPEPTRSAEVCRKPVVHTVANRDLKAVQQAKGHLRKGGVLFIERNRLTEVLGGRGEVPLEPFPGYGALDLV